MGTNYPPLAAQTSSQLELIRQFSYSIFIQHKLLRISCVIMESGARGKDQSDCDPTFNQSSAITDGLARGKYTNSGDNFRAYSTSANTSFAVPNDEISGSGCAESSRTRFDDANSSSIVEISIAAANSVETGFETGLRDFQYSLPALRCVPGIDQPTSKFNASQVPFAIKSSESRDGIAGRSAGGETESGQNQHQHPQPLQDLPDMLQVSIYVT